MIKGGATLSKGESIAGEVTELCALESGLFCEAYRETLSFLQEVPATGVNWPFLQWQSEFVWALFKLSVENP